MNERNPRLHRSPNFSKDEKLALINIIEKHRDVIEIKKTDSVSVLDKKRAWLQVAHEFNAIAPDGVHRDVAVLKRMYENKKKDVRKIAAVQRREINATGGGPPPEIKKDPVHDLVLNLMNKKTVYGFANPFDSDNIEDYGTINNETVNEVEYILELDNSQEVEDIAEIEKENDDVLSTSPNKDMLCMETSYNVATKVSEKPHKLKELQNIDNRKEANSWKKIKPANLQQTPSASLRCKKRKRPATVVRALTSSHIAEKYNILIEKRLLIADRQLNEFKEKTAEHVKRMELMDLEIRLKKKQLPE